MSSMFCLTFSMDFCFFSIDSDSERMLCISFVASFFCFFRVEISSAFLLRSCLIESRSFCWLRQSVSLFISWSSIFRYLGLFLFFRLALIGSGSFRICFMSSIFGHR